MKILKKLSEKILTDIRRGTQGIQEVTPAETPCTKKISLALKGVRGGAHDGIIGGSTGRIL